MSKAFSRVEGRIYEPMRKPPKGEHKAGTKPPVELPAIYYPPHTTPKMRAEALLNCQKVLEALLTSCCGLEIKDSPTTIDDCQSPYCTHVLLAESEELEFYCALHAPEESLRWR